MNQTPTPDRPPAIVAHMALQFERLVLNGAVEVSHTAGRWETRISIEGDRPGLLTLLYLRFGRRWGLSKDISLVVDGKPVDIDGDLARAIRILNGEHPAGDVVKRTGPHPAARGGLDSVAVRRHSVIRN